MLLAVDVGNTNTVLGLFDGSRLIDHWRISTVARSTADELGLTFAGLLGDHLDAVTGVSCCSTVPAVLHTVREICAKRFSSVPLVIVEPGVKTGVPILFDNPKEVGADRIVNSLAAFTGYGGPSIVVDFGTSTNFDVVSAKGEFIGGVLAPGIEISVDALASRAAQLRKVELARPRTAIAKNTVEALQSGMLFGTAAQVEGMVARMITALEAETTDVKVIATGYLAPLVVDECRSFTHHDPWLTLRGLELVFQRNVSH
jgi:type III pantothenate kinase